MRRRHIDLPLHVQVPLAGHLDKTAIPTLRTTACADAARETGIAIGPHHHLAAVAMAGRVGFQADACRHIHARCVLHTGVAALVVTADQHCTATAVAGGIDAGTRRKQHLIAQHLHGAAFTAKASARSGQCACNADHTAAAAAQHDLPVVFKGCISANHTGVVDHTGQQTVTRTSCQKHLPAIGLNQPAVLGQRIDLVAGDLQAQQLAARKVQADRAARTQRHRAAGGVDAALVRNAVTQQGDIAALGCVDAAKIHYARRAVTAEIAACAADGGVVRVEGGGQQSADVDLCISAKQHAVGVDQPDLAVGVDLAQNLAALRVQNAVDGQGAGGRLNEVDGLGLGYVEALPVDGEFVAGLGDGGGAFSGAAAGADAAAARDDLPALGSSPCAAA